MSEVLATSPKLAGEADTVEGRLADIFETGFVQVDEYNLSAADRAKIVAALRQVAALKSKRDGTTCYVERSKVRQILIGVADESLHITEGLLADVDDLPIFVARDFVGQS